MKDDPQYNALRNLDHGHNQDYEQDQYSDCSTDVEEINPQPKFPHQRRRKSIWARIKKYRWIIDTGLLLIIIGLLVEKRWGHRTKTKGRRYELGGDITGFAPTFSQQIKQFTPDERFAPNNASHFFTEETEANWLSIVPKGLGYLLVKDPSRYDNLPKPIHDYPNETVFTTSMTHQLHCLYTILGAYNTLRLYPFAEFDMPWHIDHCFEYLRQAIMCAGDVALEGAATTFPLDEDGMDMGGSDGWDAKHVCKNYDEVYAYLDRETVPGSEKWIAA